MKKLFVSLSVGLLSFVLSSCGEPVTSNSTNGGNANGKTTAAAPSKEDLFEREKRATEAFTKGDVKHFEPLLSGKFVTYHEGKRGGRAEELDMISKTKCDIKSSTLEDPQMSKIDDDTYALSYKSTMEGTCTWGDQTMKLPSPVRAATIWIREGTGWNAAYHSETPIMDASSQTPASNAAKADVAKKEPAKADDSKKDTATAATNSSNTSSAETETTAAKSDSVLPDPNTDALVKMHTAGWEAWKAKDSKWFDANLASSFALVAPNGQWVGSKADAVKIWTETMKCEGINNVTISDGFATALSPTVELLTLKGTADGSCDGQKNGPLYQTAVYVKEGAAWKLAFMFEQPGM
jgi:hypothetical protein